MKFKTSGNILCSGYFKTVYIFIPRNCEYMRHNSPQHLQEDWHGMFFIPSNADRQEINVLSTQERDKYG